MRKRRILSILTALALCLSLLPATALAEDVSNVGYLDAAGALQTCTSATKVQVGSPNWTGTDSDSSWYVVSSDVTINDRITVTGDVHLILVDGQTLTAPKGIYVGSSASLTIYGQSTGENSGVLKAVVYQAPNCAGIGGNSGADAAHGNITINGGVIEATGGIYAAGIGSGFGTTDKANGTITINGGTIRATGAVMYGAGIGGGYANQIAGGDIVINGGTVTATGAKWAAGIGGGYSDKQSGGRSITITGTADVTAQGGGNAAGIGCGYANANKSIRSITINGKAKVEATGGASGAGIGGSFGSASMTTGPIRIGGSAKVTAIGGDGDYGGAGIGAGGGFGKAGNIFITGGTVTATGGECTDNNDDYHGAGIGSGGYGESGAIVISAGTVTATSGGAGADGIGNGGGSGKSGDFSTTNGSNPGRAVIYADSISDKDDTSAWSGIVFLGNEGTAYGNVTLNRNLLIKNNQALTVPENAKLTLAEGKKLTVQQKGKLIVEEGAELVNSGELVNNGTLTIDNESSIKGTGSISGEGSNKIVDLELVDIHVPENAVYGGGTDYAGQITLAPKSEIKIQTASFSYDFSEWERKITMNGTTVTEAINAGTYSVTYSKGDKTVEAEFTVEKAERSIDAPSAAENGTTPTSVTLSVSEIFDDGTVEYAKSESNSAPVAGWQESTDFTGLTPNTTYYFFARVTGGDNYKDATSSGTEIITPNLTTEETPNAEFTATGPDSGILSQVTPGMAYQIDQGEWVEINGTQVTLTGLTACTISVKKTGNGTATADSEVQSIAVTKATTPAANKTDCMTSNNNDGTITGVTTAMEYKKDDGEWTEVTGDTIAGLTPGTYYIRAKAVNHMLASEMQALIIAAYQASAEADLSGLIISGGILTPAFNSETTEYSVTVDYSVTSLTVTPMVADDRVAITINGTSVTSGSEYIVELQGNDNSINITVTAENNATKTYTVNIIFKPAEVTYTITATADEGGSITPSGSVTVTEGQDQSFVITPDEGYEIDDVLVNSVSVKDELANNSYTFIGVRQDYTIAAIFQKTDEEPPVVMENYTVDVAAVPAAGGNVSGGGEYESGVSVMVTAIANAGYHFVCWTEDGSEVSTNESYIFTAEADRTLTAVFEKNEPEQPQPETYIVTLYGGGTGAFGGGAYEAGQTVTIYAGWKTDNVFLGWRCWGAELQAPDSVYTTFIMPSHHVEVEALWYKEDYSFTLPTHGITVDSGSHGDVEVWPEKAQQGTTVTITATPDKGYEVAEVVVTAENGKEITATDKGNNKYTFMMPGSDVTIEVTFLPVSGGSTSGGSLTITAPAGWVNPYTDVAVNDWFYNAVGYASANGLMGGTSATTFAPESPMNRAMVWTVIARLAGQTITGANWVEDARTWAVAQGVSDGTNPDANVTREELVTMLYRYAGSPEMNVPELGLINGYPDSADISDWAQNAFAWALSTGIIDGRDGKLAAGDSVTRAEAATILARFHMLSK